MTIKEDLLHYIWKTKSFDFQQLKTTDGRSLEILHFGHHNHDAGPDFINGRINLENIEWAGNIEMHINASDWLSHHHQEDGAYENTILHVVIHADKVIQRKDGTEIPTLALYDRIENRALSNYNRLMHTASWVPCQSLLNSVSPIAVSRMIEKALIDRISEKSEALLKELNGLNGNWHELIYRRLAWSLGLSVNANNFLSLAERTPYNIIQKHRDQLFQLEALLLGQAGFLDEKASDDYSIRLQKEYVFLKTKFSLVPMNTAVWKFSKLLPPAFPPVRIAQFAAFLHQTEYLDQLLFEASAATVDKAFEVNTSSYWDAHFRLGVSSDPRKKIIGTEKKRILTINAIVPLLFSYGESIQSQTHKDRAIALLESLPAEKNHLITKWGHLGVKATNATDTQGLVQLKKSYCDNYRCLACSIGHNIMKADLSE